MQRAQLCVLSGRHSEDTHDFYIYKCRSNQAQTFHALRRATPKSKCRSKGGVAGPDAPKMQALPKLG